MLRESERKQMEEGFMQGNSKKTTDQFPYFVSFVHVLCGHTSNSLDCSTSKSDSSLVYH